MQSLDLLQNGQERAFLYPQKRPPLRSVEMVAHGGRFRPLIDVWRNGWTMVEQLLCNHYELNVHWPHSVRLSMLLCHNKGSNYARVGILFMRIMQWCEAHMAGSSNVIWALIPIYIRSNDIHDVFNNRWLKPRTHSDNTNLTEADGTQEMADMLLCSHDHCSNRRYNPGGIDFIRLGRTAAIHTDIQDYAIAGMGINSVKELELRMDQARVVGVTCLGITHPLLANRKFDVCIVDEAGQITLPVCLGPIMYCRTFVLVGDHYQLPPLVRSAEARENGMGISLFRRLSEAHPQAVSALQCQYRMCAGVMKLSNSLIYGNRLRCGSSAVADARLEITGVSKLNPSWLRETLDPCRSVVFINTDLLPAQETKVHNAINNPTEVSILLKIIGAVVNGGVGVNEIGVISPYNSQVDLIRRFAAEACLPTLEVHTIDKYQGRDKDCILVSFVRSNSHSKSSGSSLLADWHRINVAITRAKKKLIMIGSQKTLSTTPLLRLMIEQVEQDNGVLHLPNEALPSTLPWLKRCDGTN